MLWQYDGSGRKWTADTTGIKGLSRFPYIPTIQLGCVITLRFLLKNSAFGDVFRLLVQTSETSRTRMSKKQSASLISVCSKSPGKFIFREIMLFRSHELVAHKDPMFRSRFVSTVKGDT